MTGNSTAINSALLIVLQFWLVPTSEAVEPIRQIVVGDDRSHVHSLDFAGSQSLVVAGARNLLTLWDTKKAQPTHTPIIPRSNGHLDFRLVQVSPDRSMIAALNSQRLVVIDSKSLTLIAKFDLVSAFRFLSDTLIVIQRFEQKHMAYTVALADIASKSLLSRLETATTEKAVEIAVSRKSRLVAVAYETEGVNIWDLKSRKLVHSLPSKTTVDLPSLCFAGRGDGSEWLAWALQRRDTIHFMHCGTWESAKLRGDTVKAVTALTPIGASGLLAGLQFDGSVVICDVDSARITHRFRAHNGSALAITASSDGRYLATGAADNSVRLWNLKKILIK